MNSVSAVRIEALWKRFGYRAALRGVDLSIDRSSCFAIYGANGAGKSTLLRVLATLVRPTSGRLEVLGHDTAREGQAVRRQIGVVLHESCLRADLTLAENIRFFCSLYGVSPRRSEIGELVERLGLADRQHDPVRNFSRGMLQRATLVRSLLHDPAVWLLDEPLTGLDPEGRAEVEALIRDQHRSGRTVIFITHNVEVGLRLADDAVVLGDGDIVARGRDGVRQVFAAASGGGKGAGA